MLGGSCQVAVMPFMGSMMPHQDCHGSGDIPSLAGYWSVSAGMTIWIGPSFLPSPDLQGPQKLNLWNTTGGSEEFMMGSLVVCPIPDGRKYHFSLWSYVPTQAATVAADFRAVVVWFDSLGGHFLSSFGSVLDQWEYHEFEIAVGTGCTSIRLHLWNMGGSMFVPQCFMMVDKMEFWDKTAMRPDSLTRWNSRVMVDRFYQDRLYTP